MTLDRVVDRLLAALAAEGVALPAASLAAGPSGEAGSGFDEHVETLGA